jgi:ribonucleotide monophosphatase NagD (HAD superfamily)
MGLQTYNIKWNSREISVKAKKISAEKFGQKLRDLLRIRSFTRTLTGIKGVTEGWDKEDSSVSMLIGGMSNVPMPDPEGFVRDLAEFTRTMPANLADDKEGSLGVWYMNAANLLNKHMAVENKRQTPEQHAEEVAERKADAKEREAERELKVKEDARESDIIRGQYPHLTTIQASGKSSYACGSANLKSELERAFPGISFSVKSKGFSMGSDISVYWTDGPTVKQVNEISGKYQQGHFDGMTDSYNYNHEAFTGIFGGAKYVFENREQSPALMIEAAEALGHHFTPETWPEFESTAHQYAETAELLRRIRNQAAEVSKTDSQMPTPAQEPVLASGVTVRMNEALHGVEILFPGKPSPEVIARMKAHGFRWSWKTKLWYAKQVPSRIDFANSLTVTVKEPTSGSDMLTEEQDRQGMEFCPSEHAMA